VTTPAEKYRLAAKAALELAHQAKNEATKASWLKRYKAWTRVAEEHEQRQSDVPK
jgi:hypothetical protein